MKSLTLSNTKAIVLNKEMVIAILIGVSLMTLGSKISIMVPIFMTPITLQTLALMVIGLGMKKSHAMASITTWVALVAIGLPLASGVSLVILTPSFGFILSFIVAVYTIATLKEKFNSNSIFTFSLISVIGGIVVVYAIGYTYMSIYMGLNLSQLLPFVLTYLPGDLLSVIIASAIGTKISK